MQEKKLENFHFFSASFSS